MLPIARKRLQRSGWALPWAVHAATTISTIPFLQKDFYRLFAYFNNIPNEKGFSYNYGNEEPYIKAPLPEQEKQLAVLDQRIAAAENSLQ